MLVTKKWYMSPITYEDEKYTYMDDEKRRLYLIDKKTGTIIFEGECPSLIRQIKDHEFIIIDVKTANPEESYPQRNYFFKHLQYNEENQTTQVIYEHKYQPQNYLGTIKNIEDIYIIGSLLETTLYNVNTKKELTLENATITEEKDEDGHIHLVATIEIENRLELSNIDILTLIVEKDTLEFDGFYSRLQQRYIPLIQKNNDFKLNYKQTVSAAVLYYLYQLEQQEQYYNQESYQKARETLRKYRKKIRKKDQTE